MHFNLKGAQKTIKIILSIKIYLSQCSYTVIIPKTFTASFASSYPSTSPRDWMNVSFS